MTANLPELKPGDRVQCEFASPATGWIEAEILQVSSNTLTLASGDGGLYFYRDDLASITKIEPPIQDGDMAYWDCRVWTWNGSLWVTGVGCRYTPAPADAVWLIRGGKLNPLMLAGG